MRRRPCLTAALMFALLLAPVTAYSQGLPVCSMTAAAGCQMANCPMMSSTVLSHAMPQPKMDCCDSRQKDEPATDALPAPERSKAGFAPVLWDSHSPTHAVVQGSSDPTEYFNERESPGNPEPLYERNSNLRI